MIVLIHILAYLPVNILEGVLTNFEIIKCIASCIVRETYESNLNQCNENAYIRKSCLAVS